MPRFNIHLSVGCLGANWEDVIDLDDLGVSEDEWKNLSKGEKEEILNDYVRQWSYDYIETGYCEI